MENYMFSRFLNPGFMVLLAASLVLTGCNREKRQFPNASDGTLNDAVGRKSSLQPAEAKDSRPGYKAKMPEDYQEKYEDNGYAVSQGKHLYGWYNCNGCHAAGGGGMGPALMDGKWLYGGRPEDIYATIREGRPNGMPSFAGHISEDQLLQIVAYVRSMSGQLRTDVAPNRDDSLSPHEPESRREREPIQTEKSIAP
jgi:cytochrome c oxidase cbb3-type subunit III